MFVYDKITMNDL